MQNLIAYYRVSTKGQGESGLGLDAQREAVQAFARQSGGKVLKSFTEVESGKKADRPELAAALAYAKRAGATLIVAKLDRLARNVAFLSGLMESGADFVACDNPHANKFTCHILAAVAEWEREQISARTRAALGQVKARGGVLGSARPGHWEGREEARRRGGIKGLAKAHKVIAEKARAEYADLLPTIQEMRGRGLSLAKIADALNAEGHKTRTGKVFFPSQVRNILERAK
jgi:DNA invertase Pin-like site-specific DNA recombinase